MAWTFHRETVSIPNSTQVHKLLEIVGDKEPVATHCLFTLSRLRRETALFDLQQLQEVSANLSSIEAKVLMVRIIGAMKNDLFLENLIHLTGEINPERIRAEAATAIASYDSYENLLPTIKQIVDDPSSLVKVNLINKIKLD